MVRHISVLLQAAHALTKEVAGLNDISTGEWRLLHVTGASMALVVTSLASAAFVHAFYGPLRVC